MKSPMYIFRIPINKLIRKWIFINNRRLNKFVAWNNPIRKATERLSEIITLADKRHVTKVNGLINGGIALRSRVALNLKLR